MKNYIPSLSKIILGGIMFFLMFFSSTENAFATKCMTDISGGGCIFQDSTTPPNACSMSTYEGCYYNSSGSPLSVCLINSTTSPVDGCASYSECLESKCPADNGDIDDGDTCAVSTTARISNMTFGNWDEYDEKCVHCGAGNIESAVCGNTSFTYFNGTSCTGSGDGKCESACGASSQCDERSEGYSTTVGKCEDGAGNDGCTWTPFGGLTLTASASPDPIGAAGTSTITFTVKDGATLIDGATVSTISITSGAGSITGGPSCTTTGGTCTVTYNAGGTGATIKATKATKSGFTASVSASTTVTVNSCGANQGASFNSTPYDIGDPINTRTKYDNGVNYTACLYKGSSEEYQGFKTGTGGFQGTAGVAIASVGTWTLTVEPIGGCPLFSAASSCRASTTVTAAAVPVCGDGTCNGTETEFTCPGDCPSTCTTTEVPEASCGDGNDNDCDSFIDCADLNCDGASCGGTNVCDAGSCVACLTNADCVMGEVCNTGTCIPCSGEGVAVGNISLCCPGLNLIDGKCTSKCDPSGGYFCPATGPNARTLADTGEQLIGYILGIIGSVALLLIIISGIMYMTAAGVEEKITSAKKILSGALIGLAIALLSFSLLQVLLSILNS